MTDDNVTQNTNDDSAAADDPITTPLPQTDRPFSEPDDIPDEDQKALDDTHPATDSNIQPEEEYDEGLSGAAEAEEPNRNDAVEGYNPDQRA